MKVEDFVKELTYDATVFLAMWRHEQRTHPQDFPAELPSKSEWLEQFITYLEGDHRQPLVVPIERHR